MNWILASSLMFSFSVIMYLMVRKLQYKEVDNDLVTYGLGAMPVLFLGIGALISQTNLSLTAGQHLLLAGMGIAFSYLGNKLSIASIKSAPNPGYSLVIQKSYAPYTALMAYLLFKDPLPAVKLIAILFILISVAGLLIKDTSQNKQSASRAWVIQSFGAFFLFGTLVLASRQLLLQNVSPIAVSFYVFLWASTCFTIELLRKTKLQMLFQVSKPTLMQLLLIGLLNALFNFSMQVAYATGPNVGYVNVINASSIAGVTILSPFFFKEDSLTISKLLSIIGIILGLSLLFIA